LLAYIQQKNVIDAVRLVVREELAAPRGKPSAQARRTVAE
jgi:hypothetical protein